MKIVVNIFLLLLIYQASFSQDTIPGVRDTTTAKPSEKLGVLSDTIQYNDTSIVKTAAGTDTVVKKRVHSPKQATIRSLIIPGWGQVYNKKYWKVPIVYAAIGFPVYRFFENKKWYNRIQYAISIVANERQGDLDSMSKVHPDLINFVNNNYLGSLVNYRNSYRRDMDYAILFTLLMYGLNIVDATVDGHLKAFDVSDELSLKIKPAIVPGSMVPGLALVVNFK